MIHPGNTAIFPQRNSLETDVYNIPQQIGPLAELLPFTFLIEALNVSLEQKVGAKILEVLATTLDNRIVAALFTSDDKSLIGDVIKRSALSGVLKFTGKSNYESGDIQRAVQRGQDEDCTDNMKLD